MPIAIQLFLLLLSVQTHGQTAGSEAAEPVSPPGSSAPVAVVPQPEGQAGDSGDSARSLAEELQELRARLKALREEAAVEQETAPTVTPNESALPEDAVQSDVRQRLQEELKQMREQLDVLREAASGMQLSEPPPGTTETANTSPPVPSSTQEQELEELKTQVRALQELKQMREQLARLRAQIQMERDRLEGRVPARPGQPSEAVGYTRPTLSTTPILDDRGRFRIWINPMKWTLSPYKQNTEATFEFAHHSGDAFVFVIAENLSVPINTISKMALKNIQAIAPDARLVYEDKRLVNGAEVLAVQIEGTLEGAIPITYLGYYHSGQAGTVQVVASTTKPLFEKYKSDLFELLNGLEILKRGQS